MLNSKPKVYFSKSKACHQEDISKVKEILSNYNLEIVEYDGNGSYDPSIMDDCDYMILLPPKYTYHRDAHPSLHAGKGQYIEWDYAINKAHLPVLHVLEVLDYDLSLLDIFENSELRNINLKDSYFMLWFHDRDEPFSLGEYFEKKKMKMNEMMSIIRIMRCIRAIGLCISYKIERRLISVTLIGMTLTLLIRIKGMGI